MFRKEKSLGEAGFSLLETLIAVGIGVSIMYTLSHVTVRSMQSQSRVTTKSEVTALNGLVLQVLQNTDVCPGSFIAGGAPLQFDPGAIPIAVDSIRVGASDVVRVGQAVENRVVDSIQFVDVLFNNGNKYVSTLRLGLKGRPGTADEHSPIKYKDFIVNLETDATNSIISCYAGLNQAQDFCQDIGGLWFENQIPKCRLPKLTVSPHPNDADDTPNAGLLVRGNVRLKQQLRVEQEAFVKGEKICREDGTGCPRRTYPIHHQDCPGSMCTSIVMCPVGYQITGGGCEDWGSNNQAKQSSFFTTPDGRMGWNCTYFSDWWGGQRWTKAYAVCEKTSDQ